MSVEASKRFAISTLAKELAKSITWDQGSELPRRREFAVATGFPVYFCNPHSPRQRGAKKNTNGPLSQYLPKRVNRSTFSVDDLNRIEEASTGVLERLLAMKCQWRNSLNSLLCLVEFAQNSECKHSVKVASESIDKIKKVKETSSMNEHELGHLYRVIDTGQVAY